ncbi:recombinase family protein [Paenibacillus sp. YN15]|uniref:recombinase family protein n=1 Tax=Paenibacillus sp. YN15 TaxID=1742774 RepID=UPI000DCB2FB1|nr:recombinase family protein [Paenibacillus sp. YN15]RAV06619.1 recombinase family protein [Paenibacillus sp. YN15]
MEGKLFGYIRTSTVTQSTDRQVDVLKEYGVQETDMFIDKISGTKLHRPALDQLQRVLREGDTVLVESLSRLSRSTKDLLGILEEWESRGIQFISIKERLDFSSATGKLILTVMAAISTFERDIIYARVMEGIAAAKLRGRTFGRTPTDKSKLNKALKLYEAKAHSIREICEITGVSQSVLYRALRQHRRSMKPPNPDPREK